VSELTVDPQIDAVLETMREKLEQEWTVAGLARVVGMSRTVFAERFKLATGHAPLEYLTRLRIERAIELLRDARVKLSIIAVSVGYSSQGAFHRAFQRVTGLAPGQYRRQILNSDSWLLTPDLLQIRFRVQSHVVALLPADTQVKVHHA
jgi:transcriptional regulator GlxA family with amidase domain